MSVNIRGFEPLATDQLIPFGTWLCRKGASDLFIKEMVPALMNAARIEDVNLIGMIAQSGKETRWGNFGGIVLPWFNNTAGIKIRQNNLAPEPYDHAMFGSWEAGALAHAIHLVVYTGGEPATYKGLDPRADLVTFTSAVTFADLGGPDRWAPSADYGTSIEDLVADFEALI